MDVTGWAIQAGTDNPSWFQKNGIELFSDETSTKADSVNDTLRRV